MDKLILILAGIMFSAIIFANDAALVRLAQVEETQGPEVMWLVGEVKSAVNTVLSAEIPGRIIQIVEQGHYLHQNQIIAETDTELLGLLIEENQANINGLKATLLQLQQKHARLLQLNHQNSVSQQELDDIISDLSVSENRLHSDQIRLKQLLYRQQRSVITAPFNGMVIERYAQPGEWLDVGDQVVRFVDLNDLRVEVKTPIWLQPQIAVGSPIVARLGDQSKLMNVLAAIPPGQDNDHQLKVVLDAVESGWPIGSQAQVAIPSSTDNTHLVVPYDALVIREQDIYVMHVSDDDIARRVPVEIGVGNASYIQVKGELQVGDYVVVRGAESLLDGQSVTRMEQLGAR